MIPAASCPSSIGVGRTRLPSTTDRSEWQTPAASMRTSSSSAPGGASSMSAMVMGRESAYGRGDPICSSTAPRISSMVEYNHESAVPPAPDGLTSRDFPVHWPVLTRWADNDMFGHLNNAVYYQLFDTAINGWIHTNVTLDPVTIVGAGHRRRIGLPLLLRTAFPGTTCRRGGRNPARQQQRDLSTRRIPRRRRTAATSRRPSPRSAIGCTSTSTRPPAGRRPFPTTSARCCRRPACN